MPLPDIPQGIENKANAILEDVLAQLATKQETYKTEATERSYTLQDGTVVTEPYRRNRYWQGLRTHVTIPSDGVKFAPDKSRKPSDQKEDWNDLGITLPGSMEIAIQVDTYEGPQGHGYVLVGYITIAGQTWSRAINVGPESYRSYNWRKVGN